MTATVGKTGVLGPGSAPRKSKVSKAFLSLPAQDQREEMLPLKTVLLFNCLLSFRQQANLDHRMRLEILAPMALVHISDSNGNKNREVIAQFFVT